MTLYRNLKAEAEGLLFMQSKRNLLPGISISGTGGTSAQKLEDVFNDDYGIWKVCTTYFYWQSVIF